MDNRERASLILALTKELYISVSTFERAKQEAEGRTVYGGYQVENKDSATAIHRKITLIREQLMSLSKEVKSSG